LKDLIPKPPVENRLVHVIVGDDAADERHQTRTRHDHRIPQISTPRPAEKKHREYQEAKSPQIRKVAESGKYPCTLHEDPRISSHEPRLIKLYHPQKPFAS
jgi:hypothetical protein